MYIGQQNTGSRKRLTHIGTRFSQSDQTIQWKTKIFLTSYISKIGSPHEIE